MAISRFPSLMGALFPTREKLVAAPSSVLPASFVNVHLLQFGLLSPLHGKIPPFRHSKPGSPEISPRDLPATLPRLLGGVIKRVEGRSSGMEKRARLEPLRGVNGIRERSIFESSANHSINAVTVQELPPSKRFSFFTPNTNTFPVIN